MALDEIKRQATRPSVVKHTLFRLAYRFIDTQPAVALHVLTKTPLTGRPHPWRLNSGR